MLWWRIWKKLRGNPSRFSSYWWKSNLKTPTVLVHVSKELLHFQNSAEVNRDHAQKDLRTSKLRVRHFNEKKDAKVGSIAVTYSLGNNISVAQRWGILFSPWVTALLWFNVTHEAQAEGWVVLEKPVAWWGFCLFVFPLDQLLYFGLIWIIVRALQSRVRRRALFEG